MCPKCGAAYDPETLSKTRRTKVIAAPEEPIEPMADEEIDTDSPPRRCEAEEEAEEIAGRGRGGGRGRGEEEEEEVIEDASELGEDEDDMAEVIENVEDDEER